MLNDRAAFPLINGDNSMNLRGIFEIIRCFAHSCGLHFTQFLFFFFSRPSLLLELDWLNNKSFQTKDALFLHRRFFEDRERLNTKELRYKRLTFKALFIILQQLLGHMFLISQRQVSERFLLQHLAMCLSLTLQHRQARGLHGGRGGGGGGRRCAGQKKEEEE